MKSGNQWKQSNDMNPAARTDWGLIYRSAGWSAILLILYSLITMGSLLIVGGAPNSARQAFELLQLDPVAGLLRLDALTLVVFPLYYLLFLGLIVALRRQPAPTAIGGLLALAGITLFLATPSAYSLLPLSKRYAAAVTAAEQERLLAAGEALLASNMWNSSGAVLGGILLLFGGFLFSWLMLRSDRFGRATAYVGVLTNGLDLVHKLMAFVLPSIALIFLAVAGPLYLVWFSLLTRDFFRLSRKSSGSLELEPQ